MMEFRLFRDPYRGRWKWQLVELGRIITTDVMTYESPETCLQAMGHFRQAVAEAAVFDSVQGTQIVPPAIGGGKAVPDA
jgi:hypothetical protein